MASTEDIWSQFSDKNGREIASQISPDLYEELTPDSVDDQSSYYDPSPLMALKITKNCDTVMLIFGNEGKLLYLRVFVIDGNRHFKNENRSWNLITSPMIDELLNQKKKLFCTRP